MTSAAFWGRTRMSFDTIEMIGAVEKIPGVSFQLFGVSDFKCSGVRIGRCLEVENERR